jgi:hypothetical protein
MSIENKGCAYIYCEHEPATTITVAQADGRFKCEVPVCDLHTKLLAQGSPLAVFFYAEQYASVST